MDCLFKMAAMRFVFPHTGIGFTLSVSKLR